MEKYKSIDENDMKLYIIEDDDDKILEIIKNSKIRNGDNVLK